MRDLAPFRHFTKAQLEERTLNAIAAHGITKPGDPHLLLQFNASGASGIMTQAAHHDVVVDDNPTTKLAKLLQKDGISVSLLVNSYDEPRVLTRPTKMNEKIRVDDYSVKPTWDYIREGCTSDKRAKKMSINREGIFDICSAERTPIPHHGLFTSPSSFYPFNDLVPILSNAKTSHMDDLLTPAPAYFKDYLRHTASTDKIPFSEKSKQIYWRRGSTRTDLNKGYWLDGHRHRSVYYAKLISDKILWRTSEHRSSVLSVEQNRLQLLQGYSVVQKRIVTILFDILRHYKRYFQRAIQASNYSRYRWRRHVREVLFPTQFQLSSDEAVDL